MSDDFWIFVVIYLCIGFFVREMPEQCADVLSVGDQVVVHALWPAFDEDWLTRKCGP